MKKLLLLITILGIQILLAQEFKIKQDDDAILFFNESEQTVEVWVRMKDMAINEVVAPREMKKFNNPDYLTPEHLENSEIFYAYTFRALAHDVTKSLELFEKDLANKRKILNRGYQAVNQPFYRTKNFEQFLDSASEIQQWEILAAKDLDKFTSEIVVPQSRDLLANVNQNAANNREKVIQSINKFLTTIIKDESENSMFLQQMNRFETLFTNYEKVANQRKDLGNLADNGFKVFTNNPSTDFGVYMTTNNLKLIKDYNYREMDTRGFNFEVYAAQRFAKTRVGKRRTLNYYGAASYLSYKDKEYELKKSFINIGPEIRYTGYYENQVQLIAGAGLTADITAEKYIPETDSRKFGFYASGEISLLFIRLGMRYYSGLAEEALMPEGHWFYRLGIVGKF